MKKIKILLIFLILLIIGIRVNAYDLQKNDKIYVSGEAIGIKLNSGVEVVGTFAVKTDNALSMPWEECGLCEGDKIISLNGKNIENSKDLLQALKLSNGKKCDITYIRNLQEYKSYITPASKNDEYSLGLYIKDSILGVGTLTYYIKEANIFGSLGHKMTNDTFYSGEIYEAKVDSIVKPQRNQAGEKKATIDGDKIGNIVENTDTGIHGNATTKIDVSDMKLLNFKTRDEVSLGEAEIWTCLEGEKVERFKIKITNLEKQNKNSIKGITFEVTDPVLLDKAGGIVQGMSGSPIVQNNCLIGAVTHVSIKDSKVGFGIYIEWMFEDMDITITE